MTATFAPTDNGLKLQREYQITPRDIVEEDERELGNVKSVAIAGLPIWEFGSLVYHAVTREASEYARSFYSQIGGRAGRFFYALPEFVPAPALAPTLTAVVSGAQAQRTIHVRYAWQNDTGLTQASPTATLLVPLNSLVKVTIPSLYPRGITECVIYATQGSLGTEVEQVTLTNALSWTQPDAALLTGTAEAATANTCQETPLCKFTSPLVVRRLAGTSYRVEVAIEEA